MSKLIKKELFTLAQFFAFALAACLWAFVVTFRLADVHVHVNVSEAWRNVAPFVNQLLLAFLALSGARLALVLAAARLRHPPE